jgi:hypothetical protein
MTSPPDSGGIIALTAYHGARMGGECEPTGLGTLLDRICQYLRFR